MLRCSSRNRFRRAAQPDTDLMLDRQLHRLEGERSNLPQDSTSRAISPPSNVGNALHQTISVQLTNSVDLEKGIYPPPNAPSSDQDDFKEKNGSSQGTSSSESSRHPSATAFLPTLDTVP